MHQKTFIVFNISSSPDMTSKFVQEVMLKENTFFEFIANNVNKQNKDFIVKNFQLCHLKSKKL